MEVKRVQKILEDNAISKNFQHLHYLLTSSMCFASRFFFVCVLFSFFCNETQPELAIHQLVGCQEEDERSCKGVMSFPPETQGSVVSGYISVWDFDPFHQPTYCTFPKGFKDDFPKTSCCMLLLRS